MKNSNSLSKPSSDIEKTMTWFVMEVVCEMVFRLGEKKATCLSSLPSHTRVCLTQTWGPWCVLVTWSMCSLRYTSGLTFIATTEVDSSSHLLFRLLQHLVQVYLQGYHCARSLLCYPTSWVHMKATTLWGAILCFVLYHITWLSTVVQYLLNIYEWWICEASL